MGSHDDVFVIKSHAGGTAKFGSDLAIGVGVNAEQFDQMTAQSFAGAKNTRERFRLRRAVPPGKTSVGTLPTEVKQ